MRNKLYILIGLFLTIQSLGFAQVSSNQQHQKIFKPHFRSTKVNKEVLLSVQDIKKALKIDSVESEMGVPFRFGKNISTDIDFMKEAVIHYNGDTIFYDYEIKSPKAFSINLIFDVLELNEHSFLNIYNADETFIYGPVKSKDVPPKGQFWTDLIKGDHIIIEVIEIGKSHIKNQIHISSIVHGYKNTFYTPNNYGDSFSCNIDIACSQGDNWRKDGDAVSMLLLDEATRWCSGSLVNNTAKDFKGYLLTAFHCLDLNGDGSLSGSEKGYVNNWLFRFRYQSPTCGGGDGNNYLTFNGSAFRAAYQQSDFALLELLTSPNISHCITYAGWSRSSSSASSGVGIHHPQGDVKKISFDNNPLSSNSSTISWSNGTVSPKNTHWVVGFDQGTTQGGSSGSPIFDQNHRIVGQLHGGANGCAPITKYYGRFDVSWTGGGTNDTRLSNWLDPLNMGLLSLDTENPVSISGPTLVCNSAVYSIPNLPAGATVSWSASGAIAISGSSTGSTVTAIQNYSGNGTLTATINTGCGSTTISKQIAAGAGAVGGTYSYGWNTFQVTGSTGIGVSNSSNTIYFNLANGWDPSTTYQWRIDNQQGYGYLSATSGKNVNMYLSGGTSMNVTCTVSTPCGSTSVSFSCYNYSGSYIAYPNPANETITVTAVKQLVSDDNINDKAFIQSSPIATEIEHISVKLFDKNNKIIAYGELLNGRVDLSIQHVPNGVYYLHIGQGKEVTKKQIIIQH